MSLDAAYAELVERAVDDGITRAAEKIAGPRRLAWTVPEVAWSLGTSADTVRRLIDEGRLPLVPHVGRRQLIPVAALEVFVLAGASTSSIPPGGVDGLSGDGTDGTDPPGSVSPLTRRGRRQPEDDTAPGSNPGAA